MNLQKKLIQLSQYRCSFKYVDSYFLVSMTYPDNWNVIPCEDKTIEVADENGVTFYAAPIETDIEKTFNLIDDTIAYNLDVEKKLSLLKYNINKLQEMFAEKDLEELETIQFVTTPISVKKEKKTTKSRKANVSDNKKTERKRKEKPNNKEDVANGDRLIETPNWGGLDNCVDDTNYCVAELNVTTESTPSENKFLEEIVR